MAIAAGTGLVVGYEREIRGRAAGHRTFALMTVGAAAFTASALLVPSEVGRVIGGIVTGVGFLGAGLVWRGAGDNVHGLTTAAAVWAMVAVGIVIGLGALWLGAGLTGIVLVLLELPYIPVVKQIDPRRVEHRFARDTDAPEMQDRDGRPGAM
jgi:putative Mg2+ transporter-C (MgtC) family protein